MKAKGLKIIILVLIVVAAISAAVMLLWNALIPAIFGLSTINFLQALGLFILARLLFGGFGRFGHGMRMRGGMDHSHHNPLREKWMSMSEEERKEFIKRRRNFFGNRGRHFEGDFYGNPHYGNPHRTNSPYENSPHENPNHGHPHTEKGDE